MYFMGMAQPHPNHETRSKEQPTPIRRYHGDDLPTAPRASDEDVAATEGVASTMRARWQDLVGQVRAGRVYACVLGIVMFHPARKEGCARSLDLFCHAVWSVSRGGLESCLVPLGVVLTERSSLVGIRWRPLGCLVCNFSRRRVSSGNGGLCRQCVLLLRRVCPYRR